MTTVGEPIEPDPGERPEVVADELLVHGLLQSAADDPPALRRRVAAVLAALDGRRARRGQPVGRWVVAGAAAACVIAFLVWRAASGPDAASLVEAATVAARQAGDRRYRVEASLSAGGEDVAVRGELDVRGNDQYLLRATIHGASITTGAEGGTPWVEGEEPVAAHLRALLRSQPRGTPAFVLDRSTFTLGSVDAFLARLPADYRLEARGPASLTEHPGVAFQHVVAERTAASAVPVHVELWLDPRSGLVQRLELRWRSDGRPPSAMPDHRMLLDLSGPVTLPDDWFRHERHR